METKQMMELLLARMNASIEEHMQKMKADKMADKARMEAKLDASHKNMMAAMLDAHHERIMVPL
jgi:hypothetical protein